MMLPARSRKLVESTPIHRLKSGFKACLEVTMYPDGHAGIAVSEIDDSARPRTIVQSDALPLNDLDELRSHVLAVLDLLAEHVRASDGAP